MKLSTGQDSTLGEYEKLTKTLFGENSKPHQFIKNKIAESPDGKDEMVIQHESQMLLLFGSMMKNN